MAVEFRQFTKEELEEAERQARRNRQNIRIQVSPSDQGGVILARRGPKGFGSVGSIAQYVVQVYNSRVRTDSGIVEAINCLRLSIDSLLK